MKKTVVAASALALSTLSPVRGPAVYFQVAKLTVFAA
jgi:hypothetical protein